MAEKLLFKFVKEANDNKRRLVVPLVGFPGLNMTGGTIKLAQQNYSEHFKTIKANVEKFKPDVIFPFMDLSVEANALGRYTIFPKSDSATVVKDKFNLEDLAALEKINIQTDMRLLGYVETVKLMSNELPSSILKGAYVTGPYTLTALLIGADEAAIATIMSPDDLHKVCRFATEKIKEYVKLLIESGAQLVCMLEPSAVMLGPMQFEEFSGQYVKDISNICHHSDVSSIYHVCGNTMHLIEKMSDSGVDALSLDSLEAGVDLPEAAKRVPEDVVIMGNISPIGALLNGKTDVVEKEVIQLLERMEPFPNFILSTGCDLPQQTPIENIEAFMKAGRSYKLA